MSKVYARLKIAEQANVLNFAKFSYIATFRTVTGRVGVTQKIPFENNGLGRECSYDLKKNETAENTTVTFKVFMPSGREYNPDVLIHGYTYGKTEGSQAKISEYKLKLFGDSTNKEPNTRIPNRQVLSTHPVPDGLRMVAFLREPILNAAKNNGIDAQIIGSIVFEEKYHGVWAYRKNLLLYVATLGGLSETDSYGYGEMQLGLAGELLEIDKTRPNWMDEVFVLICTDAEIAMDLVAKNMRKLNKLIGRKATLQESTVYYNAGPVALKSWQAGEIPASKLKTAVYARSWNWQKAIKLALSGDVIAIPDDAKGNYRADPEYSTEKWVFDPSLNKLDL